MFEDDHLNLYAYALMFCGVVLGASFFAAQPNIEPAGIALEAEALGDIETASVTGPAANGPAAWNAPTIPWQDYDAGMEEVARTNKPAVLVLHADWCLVCRDYRELFTDERIEAYADDFVFILADIEARPDVQRRYDVDGDYIPRTFVLSPDGSLMHDATGGYTRQRFFINPYQTQPLNALLARSRRSGL
ncbi:MAG: thioredoxin family protein [Pseudomonadota bacterium]